MKKFLLSMLVMAMAGVSANATVIDDYSGTLDGYTATVILDANGGSSNTASWAIVDGALTYTTSAYDGIEQSALIKDGYTLNVGEELQANVANNQSSQDLGLYVGVAPTAGVRANYVAVYARNDGDMFTRGFDGTGEYGLVGDWNNPTYDTLFIARTAENTFELGYYNGEVRVVMATRTPVNTLAGADLVVGYYTDVRGAGTLGSADNLAIVPEPATLSILGLGALFAARRRK